jgi:hypothetical protein
VRTILDLPVVLWCDAKAQASREGRALGDVLRDAVHRHLTEQEIPHGE